MDEITKNLTNYELIDSGQGEKLERFGDKILSRPDPQAIWNKRLNNEEWTRAEAHFNRSSISGKWKKNENFPLSWKVDFDGLVFNLELLPSKHVGVFPEQFSNWQWIKEVVLESVKRGEKVKALNLFANTGGSTMAMLSAEAEVVHVDSSKNIISVAKNNVIDSGLDINKVRFIVDDVKKFVEREVKRKSKYDFIVLDPPIYGKGLKKEIWRLEEDLPNLLINLRKVTSDNFKAILLNGYASIYSSKTYENILRDVFVEDGVFSSGQLLIEESKSNRLFPMAIYARFIKNK